MRFRFSRISVCRYENISLTLVISTAPCSQRRLALEIKSSISLSVMSENSSPSVLVMNLETATNQFQSDNRDLRNSCTFLLFILGVCLCIIKISGTERRDPSFQCLDPPGDLATKWSTEKTCDAFLSNASPRRFRE